MIIHETDRKKITSCKIMLPEEGKNIVEFMNYKNKEKIPFIIYSDCKCFLKPVNESQERNSNTEVFEWHELFDNGYYLKSSYDESLSGYHSCPDVVDPSKSCAKELKQLAKGAETVFMCPIPVDQLIQDQKAAHR